MWNRALIDAPVSVPVLGPAQADPVDGGTWRPPTGLEPGYHVNLPEVWMTEALEPYRVSPQAPARVLAGEPTAFLKFADEAAAAAALPPPWSE